jgi:hypothetical protein
MTTNQPSRPQLDDFFSLPLVERLVHPDHSPTDTDREAADRIKTLECMTDRERELQETVNTLTIRAYRAEDERDEWRRLYNDTAAKLNAANARISAAREALGD